jgi:hypothetical protein
LPGVADASPVAEKTTLLSVICNRANGFMVPIPTFCAVAQRESMIAGSNNNFFIAKYFFWFWKNICTGHMAGMVIDIDANTCLCMKKKRREGQQENNYSFHAVYFLKDTIICSVAALPIFLIHQFAVAVL